MRSCFGQLPILSQSIKPFCYLAALADPSSNPSPSPAHLDRTSSVRSAAVLASSSADSFVAQPRRSLSVTSRATSEFPSSYLAPATTATCSPYAELSLGPCRPSHHLRHHSCAIRKTCIYSGITHTSQSTALAGTRLTASHLCSSRGSPRRLLWFALNHVPRHHHHCESLYDRSAPSPRISCPRRHFPRRVISSASNINRHHFSTIREAALQWSTWGIVLLSRATLIRSIHSATPSSLRRVAQTDSLYLEDRTARGHHCRTCEHLFYLIGSL